MDALVSHRLSGQEYQVTLYVIRKTYGFNKVFDYISMGQIADATGIKRPKVALLLKTLCEKKIISVTKKDNNKLNCLAFSKDYDNWKVLPKKITIPTRSTHLFKDNREDKTGRKCLICSMDEFYTHNGEYMLHKHHIEWKLNKNNLPKSDKTSSTILVCFRCHRNIHKNVIQKDTILKLLSNLVTVPQKDTLMFPKKVPLMLPKMVHTKESIKETLTKESNTMSPVAIIISILNSVLGTKYKISSKKTIDLIQVRMKEGFTVEDFKTVIEKKYAEWGQDEKMSAFLRPETLFGAKFEAYLNQVIVRPMSKNEQTIDRVFKQMEELENDKRRSKDAGNENDIIIS